MALGSNEGREQPKKSSLPPGGETVGNGGKKLTPKLVSSFKPKKKVSEGF